MRSAIVSRMKLTIEPFRSASLIGSRKTHSVLSEYVLAASGLKRPYARLCLEAQDLRHDTRDLPLRIVNARMLKMLPFCDEFDRLFSDLLTTRLLLPDIKQCFARLVGLKLSIGDDPQYWHVPTASLNIETPAPIDVLAVIKEMESVLVWPCCTFNLDCGHAVSFADGVFSIDGQIADEKAVLGLLDSASDYSALVEWGQVQEPNRPFEVIVLKVCGFRVLSGEMKTCNMGLFDLVSRRGVEIHGGSLLSCQTIAPELCENARQVIEDILTAFPELEYVCGWFAITKRGLALVQVDTGLDVAFSDNLMPEVLSHFEEVRKRNHSISLNGRARSYIKELSEVYAEHRGFLGFMYRNWIRGILDDYRSSNTSLLDKLWAHTRGFYSYRIAQYGLTSDNVDEFLSDYDYKQLRPINGPYGKWLWDKVSTFLVMRPFARYMPAHYCRIDGAKSGRVIPFGQLAIDSIPAIIALLENEGTLAVKRAIGSHGKGFHKLEYRGVIDEYYVDGILCSTRRLVEFLESLDDEFMITEYVVMHPVLASWYEGAVSTVRIMAIRFGSAFEICNAYVRIGTSMTGGTDNLVSGGIVAKVDLDSGEVSNPERIVRHEFWPCEVHPDTGEPITGIIPHWSEIKEQVELMCQYLFPLEYLGFDIVATSDGFKVLEINTHQDLHKYAYYPEKVKAFFLTKHRSDGYQVHSGYYAY